MQKLLGYITGFLGSRHFIPLTFTSAALLRLLWITLFPNPPVSDFLWYYNAAQSMNSGGGYAVNGIATAWFPVGYPLVLAFAMKIMGAGLWTVWTVNLLISLGALWGAYFLAKRLFSSEIAGRTALLIIAFHPDSITSVTLAGSDMLNVLFLLLGMIWVLNPKQNWWISVFSGVFFGIAFLTRPVSIAVPFAYLLVYAVSLKKPFINKQALIRFGLTLVGIAICVSPWALRNHAVFGGFIPVSTNGGYNLVIGNSGGTTGGWIRSREVFALVKEPFQTVAVEGLDKYLWQPGGTQQLGMEPNQLNEYTFDKACGKAGMVYIKNNPLSAAKNYAKKMLMLYRRDDDGVSWNYEQLKVKTQSRVILLGIVRKISNLYFYVILTGFGLAVIAAISQPKGSKIKEGMILPSVVIVFLSGITCVFIALPRYHAPMTYLMAVGAAGLAVFLINRKPEAESHCIDE